MPICSSALLESPKVTESHMMSPLIWKHIVSFASGYRSSHRRKRGKVEQGGKGHG